MRVLAEFVDARSGKRYLRGDGDKIHPSLDPEQIERLKKSGCIGDGSEPKPVEAGKDRKGHQPSETNLDDLTVPELKELAEKREIDLGDATKKADIIAAIELHQEAK